MSAVASVNPIFRAEDAAGAALPFALLYTYVNHSTTPLAAYTDATGAVPLSNPIQCDANGTCVPWLTAGVAYRFVLTDQFGTVQPHYPMDDVMGGATGQTGAAGSVWRNGNGVPSNAVGANGDYYLDDLTGDVYVQLEMSSLMDRSTRAFCLGEPPGLWLLHLVLDRLRSLDLPSNLLSLGQGSL